MFNWRLELIKPSPLDLFLVVWYNQMCLNEPMFLPEWTWTVISRCNVCPAGCLCSGVIPVSLLARGFPSSRSTQGYYCGGGSELCCYTRLKFPTAIRANISERSQPDKSITSSLVYLTKLLLKVNMKSQPSWRGCEHSGSVFIHLLRKWCDYGLSNQSSLERNRLQVYWFSLIPLKCFSVLAQTLFFSPQQLGLTLGSLVPRDSPRLVHV